MLGADWRDLPLRALPDEQATGNRETPGAPLARRAPRRMNARPPPQVVWRNWLAELDLSQDLSRFFRSKWSGFCQIRTIEMGPEQGVYIVTFEDGSTLGKKRVIDRDNSVPFQVEQDAKTYDTAE